MTSLRQRAANRRNAQLSTGPRTKAGLKRAAANALKHGLNAPIDSSFWVDHLEGLSALLQSEGLDPSAAHEIAIRLIEFERNLAYQRQRFLDEVVGKPIITNVCAEAQGDLDAADLVANFRAQGLEAQLFDGLSKREARELRAANRDAAKELKNADRHLRRAANQLIKQLKSIGDN